MKRIMVTGSNGFVGKHLVAELQHNNIEVVKIVGSQGDDESLVVDLMDATATISIDFTDIDAVIHLAALASNGASFGDPLKYINTNMGMQINLFESAKMQDQHPLFLLVSSGSVYDPEEALPLQETANTKPSSPYAVSKLGQEELGRYYGSIGFNVIIARPFNHIGPGQSLGFIVPDIAAQMAAFKQGTVENIIVGNLDAERDFTDVRDIVRAYRLLVDLGKSGETYNVCSGTALSGHDIVSGLAKVFDIKPKIVVDQKKMRPSDNPVIYGSCEKLRSHTSWQPEIDIATTLEDVVSKMSF